VEIKFHGKWSFPAICPPNLEHIKEREQYPLITRLSIASNYPIPFSFLSYEFFHLHWIITISFSAHSSYSSQMYLTGFL
jgi:hypothetical protein